MSGDNGRLRTAVGTVDQDFGFVPRSGQKSSPLSIMWRFLRERKGLFFGVLGVRLVKDLLPFQGPILVGMAADILTNTDRTLLGWDLPKLTTRSLVIIVIAMALLALAKMILGYIHTIISAHLGRHVVEAARRDLADATMHMALDDRRRFNSGDLLDRSLADSKGLRSFAQSVLIRMISNTVRIIYPVTWMFIIDPVLAVIGLAIIPLQFGVVNFLQLRLQRQTRAARQRESEHTSSVKEAIDGWSSVASVGGQDWVAGELRDTASAAEDAKIKKKHTTAQISAVMTIFTQTGVALLYLAGGWRIIGALNSAEAGGTGSLAGVLTLGTLVTFIGLAKKTYAPFEAYAKIAGSYRTGIVNLERVGEVLDASMIDARADGPELKIAEGEVTLENLTFSYDGAPTPVIKDLTGTIPGRKLTVVTGTSGTGKTTLLRLIMGLDVPAAGTVLIDGQDVNKARLSSVRKAMALVPQEPMLFSGSLGENLMLGRPDATTEDLLDVCHKAGLLELVRELPNGLDTPVGSGRHMLSGGQLRRMAIARALLRRPALLLLDEPTAGLDKHHSEQVLDTLRRISSDTTVIMVSHRSLPLARSEHHLVLDGGAWTQGVAGRDSRLSTDNDHQRIAAPRIAPAGESTQNDASAPVGHIASLVADEPQTNGAHPNGTNGSTAPDQVTMQTGHRVIGLSAMGRPIVMNSIARTDSVASLFVLAGHRVGCTAALGELMPELLAGLAADDVPVDVNAISNLNPDGAWTDDGRTILGIDLAADHHRRGATETMVMHRSISTVGADLILDVGYDSTPGVGAADVDIAVRYRPTGDAPTTAWMNQIAADIERRLASSRFSFHIHLEPCTADSITAAWGTPVIELTAAAVPTAETRRYLDALTESAVAVQGAAALSRPALAST